MATDLRDLLPLLAAMSALGAAVFGFGTWPLRRKLTMIDFVALALGVRATVKGASGESPVRTELIFVIFLATLVLGLKLVHRRKQASRDAGGHEPKSK